MISIIVLLIQSWTFFGFESWAKETPTIDFTLHYTSPDPGGAPGISQQFLGVQPIQTNNLYNQFTSRLDSFKVALQNETTSSKNLLAAQITIIQGYSESVQRADSILQNATTNLVVLKAQTQRLSGSLSQKPIMPTGYVLESATGPFQDQVVELYYRMNYLAPGTPAQANVKQFSLITLEAADRAFSRGDTREAERLYESAKQLADSALLMRPGSNLGHDAVATHFLPDQEYQRRLGGVVIQSRLETLEGQRLRSHLNTVVLAETSVNIQCGNPQFLTGNAEGCFAFNSHVERVKAGLVLSDRLAANNQIETYNKLMATLQPYMDGLSGFAGGVLKGSLSLGVGLATAAFLPEAAILTAASAAIGYATYQAITAISEHSEGLKGLIREKWQEFTQADTARKGEILGELTVAVGGLLYGGPITQEINSALKPAVELAISRVAAREMILASSSGAALPGGFTKALNLLADEAPLATTTILKGTPASQLQDALPSLSDEAVSGLTRLREMAPGTAESFLKESADDALFLGKNFSRSTEEFRSQLLEYGKNEKLTVGKLAIISEFKDGASYFLPKKAYEEFVLSENFTTLGRADGLFVLPRAVADRLMIKAGKSTAEWNRFLGLKIGYNPAKPETLVRINLPFRWTYNPKVPSGFESGANTFFKFGGTTSGGLPEIIFIQPAKTDIIDHIIIEGLIQ
jgi:hypothetical protein